MRPFVFINMASSLDGKISNERREQVRISSPEDFQTVDMLRAGSDAVMVGIGTVLSDNPRLTVKSRELREMRVNKGLSPNPVRIVVDSRCRIPPDSEILNDEAHTVVAVSEAAEKTRIEEIGKRAEVIVVGEKRVNLVELLRILYRKGVRRIMVEGGGELNYSLIKEGLVDEIRIFYSGVIIGGRNSPTPVEGEMFEIPVNAELKSFKALGNGVAVVWRLR